MCAMSHFDPQKLPFFQREPTADVRAGFDFFGFAVEAAADEVFLMQSDSKIMYVNQSACERLEYTREELTGKYVWEWDPLFPEEAWPGFWEEFTHAGHLHFETQHRSKSGEVFPVEIHAHYYENASKGYLLAFVNDLTEKKRIQEQLEQNQAQLEEQVRLRTQELEWANRDLEIKRQEAEQVSEAKSQFLSVMSHELRTPLTSIKGGLSLLKNQAVTEPCKMQEIINLAYRNSEVLEKLVNDTLDYEKLRREGLPFIDSPFYMRELVQANIRQVQGYADHHGVQIGYEGSKRQPLLVNADEIRLSQVIFNLLSNAIKYSPQQGVVQVRVLEKPHQRIHVGFQDSGPGIPTEQRHRLFQLFSQLDSSDSREKGGTGLGLAISKGIIDHYDGLIACDSPPGQGAYFYFELTGLTS